MSRTEVRDLLGPARRDLLRCVHCGLCLTSCPTYGVTKLEAESPRGRIYLMRALAEGRVESDRSISRHFDLCLNCRACETACPAGVEYGHLLEATRARLQTELPPTAGERVRDLALEHLFPHPERMAFVTRAMGWAQDLGLAQLARSPLGRLLPGFARAGAELWPESIDGQAVEPGVYAPYHGSPRMTVGWFRTCLMPPLFPAADRAAVHLLREAGARVVIPERQGCCGSLHAHSGKRETARKLARANLAAFAEAGPLDRIATDAAGCGATLREYPALFHGSTGARAGDVPEGIEDFAQRVRDITEVLVELGLPQPRAEVRERIAVHDPCHLAHAQKVRSAPRELLRALPGADVVDLAKSDRCCGSAGIYNLVQTEMAAQLLAEKMQTVEDARPTLVAVANPGCLLQMQWGARQRGLRIPHLHPVEIVARAYPPQDGGGHA